MIGKIKKLLCFLIISIFIIGFGGEVVKAETFTSLGTLKYRKWGNGTSLDNYTYFQHIQLNGEDAFCLNSTKNFPSVSLTLMDGLVPNSKKQQLINVIKAGTPSNLGLSHGEAYYLTQAAVWYVMGDVVPNNRETDGLGLGFHNWILANYPTQWKILMDAIGSTSSSDYYFNVMSDGSNLSESDGYMMSENFSFSTNVKGNVVISINGGSSTGACVLYNSTCSDSVEIPADAKFKIRVDKPTDSNGTVDASFTAKPKTNPNVYTLKTYGGASSQGFQNVAIIDSEPKEFSVKQAVSGNYTNTLNVQIQKIDYETGKKVAGAFIEVYKSDDSLIDMYKSTDETETNPVLNLPVGDYYLKELLAPSGYTLNTEKVDFSVVDDNGTLKVKQNNQFVDSATLSLRNKPLKVKFRKTDKDGNPIEGMKFEITSYSDVQIGGQNARLCAYSDSNGYLTVPCDGYESIVKSDGVYWLGHDFGKTSDIYQILESCDNEKCKGYDTTPLSGNNELKVDENGNVISLRSYIIVDDSDTSEIPVVNINFVNKRFINIGKTDVTSGAEIEDAHLKVYDLSIKEGDNVVDEWVSEKDKTHQIVNIEVGKRYALEETIAPKGYVAISTAIHFEMDKDGKIKVFDPETGSEIKDMAGSDYKLLITNEPTKVHISKTDMVTGEEVPGAEIKLCSAEEYEKSGLDCKPSKEEWSWESSDKPQYIEKLPVGDYYLIETVAPEGYVRQTNAVKFSVKEETGIQQVEFTNEPTKVTVEKKDYKTGKPISNVTFQIINVKTNEVVREWVSDNLDEGHIEYAIPMGKYKLVETVYPEGYKEGMIVDGIVTSEYEFEITEDVSEITITVYNEALTDVPSTGISTINLFAIGGLMVFIGYQVIRIYRRRVIS